MTEVKEDHGGRDLFDRTPVRVGLFAVIPLIIFVLVCAGIRVSQYGIDHTIVVLGQRQLAAGFPGALRVTLIADDQGFFLPDSMTGYLVRGEERHRLFGGMVRDAGYALARGFTVPKMSPGPARLELDIEFDERRRVVSAPVEITDGDPLETLAVPEDAGKAGRISKVELGDVILQAMTEDRGAPTGLSSALFLRTVDSAGKPVSANARLKAFDAEEYRDLRTDRLGLGAFMIKPADLDHPVSVEGAKPEHLFPKVVYSGIGVVVHNPVATKGEPIRLNIRQITRGGPVYADLFHNGSWIEAASAWAGADGGTSMQLRPQVTGLVRVQITNFALDPGRAVAVRHVYVLEEGQDQNDGLRAVLERLSRGGSREDASWARAALETNLEGGAGFDRRLASAFALARMYAGHRPPVELISSRREDDRELEEYKSGFQRGVMLVIVAMGVAVALLIGLIAAQARRRQRRLTLMIASDGEADPAIGPASGGLPRASLQVLVVIVIVVGAFASIALLIDTMTWGR